MVITSGVPGNPLTEVGVAQVEQTAEALQVTGVTALYSSPLLRARQSAEILGKALDLPVDYDDALCECDVGALEGRSDEASFVRFNEALDEWYLKENQDFPLGPGGETAASVVNRTGDFLDRVVASHDADAVVVAVSHQTLLQLVLAYHSTNISPAFGHRRWLSNGGRSVLEMTPTGISCLEWDGVSVTQASA